VTSSQELLKLTQSRHSDHSSHRLLFCLCRPRLSLYHLPVYRLPLYYYHSLSPLPFCSLSTCRCKIIIAKSQTKEQLRPGRPLVPFHKTRTDVPAVGVIVDRKRRAGTPITARARAIVAKGEEGERGVRRNKAKIRRSGQFSHSCYLTFLNASCPSRSSI
jgi:hypothetical protein